MSFNLLYIKSVLLQNDFEAVIIMKKILHNVALTTDFSLLYMSRNYKILSHKCKYFPYDVIKNKFPGFLIRVDTLVTKETKYIDNC